MPGAEFKIGVIRTAAAAVAAFEHHSAGTYNYIQLQDIIQRVTATCQWRLLPKPSILGPFVTRPQTLSRLTHASFYLPADDVPFMRNANNKTPDEPLGSCYMISLATEWRMELFVTAAVNAICTVHSRLIFPQ